MRVTENRKPVCLITGGSSGIGLATAVRFAGQGYQLAICGRREAALRIAEQAIRLAGTTHGIECFSCVTDLNDVEQAKQFAQQSLNKFGRIDVLVNNAAAAPLAPFEEISAESFECAINTNIRSLFYLTQIVWAEMKRRATESEAPCDRERGVVVNVSSLAAVDPFPGFSLYGACKSWLDLLTIALAIEGREMGLRVCSIRPGAVETPLLRRLFPDFPADQCVPPEAIAEAVWACVDRPVDFPTGQAFPISNQFAVD